MTGAPRPAILLLLSVLACSSPERDPTLHVTLPAGVVARVGTSDVATTTVTRIAAAQGVSPRAAAERAISDALLAEAVSSELGRPDLAAVATRSAHSRSLVEALQVAAAAAGAPSDDEIAKLTAERWTELDRPVTVRTSHAVALVKAPADAAAARELMGRLAEALSGVRDPVAFRERALALARTAGGAIEVRAERLLPVAPDGRTFDPDGVQQAGRLDETYTRAAHALAAAGDQSPLIETRFGFHVILLEERLPEQRTTLEERRRLLERDVIVRRAEAELRALLATLRSTTSLEVSRAAEQLTAGVAVAP